MAKPSASQISRPGKAADRIVFCSSGLEENGIPDIPAGSACFHSFDLGTRDTVMGMDFIVISS